MSKFFEKARYQTVAIAMTNNRRHHRSRKGDGNINRRLVKNVEFSLNDFGFRQKKIHNSLLQTPFYDSDKKFAFLKTLGTCNSIQTFKVTKRGKRLF